MYVVYKNGNGASLNANIYWSSTGYDNDFAWNRFFFTGDQYNEYKDGTGYVRAVRAF
jgi:hypothetical protein